MNSHYLAILSLALCLLGACQSSEKKLTSKLEKETISRTVDSSDIQFLLFQEDGLLEVWTFQEGSTPTILEQISLSGGIDFPVGIYRWQDTATGLVIRYPNSFYTEKLGDRAKAQQISLDSYVATQPALNKWKPYAEGKKVLVLPNEFGKNNEHASCFACPHWMAEVYGKLNVEMALLGRDK